MFYVAFFAFLKVDSCLKEDVNYFCVHIFTFRMCVYFVLDSHKKYSQLLSLMEIMDFFIVI